MAPGSELLVTLALMVGAYLVCAIPFGLIVSKVGAHVDVRQTGSGNIGTTNVARSVGKGAAALTLLLDAGKAWVCVSVARMVAADMLCAGDATVLAPASRLGWTVACVFLASVLGHVFSPYLGFKGGKGIAVGFGGSLALVPLAGLALLVVFASVFLISRIVSLASVLAAASLPMLCLLLYGSNLAFTLVICVASCVSVWAHRANIRRLAHGEEARFSFHAANDGGGNDGDE